MADLSKFRINGVDYDLKDPTARQNSGGTDYPNWSHLKWYVMGDSLTAQDNDFTVKRYYDFVHEKTGIQLIVDGVGGTGYGAGVSTGQSFLDRVQNIPDDVDVVTIFGSGNDILYEVDYNAPIYNALTWIAFKRPGLRVIVAPPAPWKGYQKRSETWKAYCDRLQVCALACDFRYLSDLWECPPFNPNFEGHTEKFFTTDPEGIHPNEAGHEALATYFYNALAQELEFNAGFGVSGSGGNVDLTGVVKSVNGQTPDDNGNVQIAVSSGGASWTTAQIDLLDSLFSAIPWTTGTAGALADSLIASLRSTSSGGGNTGGESGGEDEPETGATDNITQSGNTLIITSLATAPIQSGSVLTIA